MTGCSKADMQTNAVVVGVVVEERLQRESVEVVEVSWRVLLLRERT